MTGGSRFPVTIPFLHWLGVEMVEHSAGRATLELATEAHHRNSFGVAHGGVLMTLLDVAMAMAGRSLAHPEAGEIGVSGTEQGMVTIEMKTTFMQPAHGKLVASGHCLHRTVSMAFCEADIHDERGHLVARGSGTFKYMRQRKIGA